jgi:hypothetical protein
LQDKPAYVQALKAASEKRDMGPRADEDEWIPFFSFLEKLGDKSETAVTPCKCGAAAARPSFMSQLASRPDFQWHPFFP